MNEQNVKIEVLLLERNPSHSSFLDLPGRSWRRWMRQSRSRQSQSHSPPPGQTSALLGRSHTFVPPDMTTWSPAMTPPWHSWTHTHITQHQDEEGMVRTSVVQFTVYSQVCLPSGRCNRSFKTAFECSNCETLFKHLLHLLCSTHSAGLLILLKC